MYLCSVRRYFINFQTLWNVWRYTVINVGYQISDFHRIFIFSHQWYANSLGFKTGFKDDSGNFGVDVDSCGFGSNLEM